ncbi:MAG: DDE-type integrase/transposase/recombinase, partial [Nitrososphaeria archaeon]
PAMSTNPIQIRRRTPLPVMAYAVYLYFSGPSPGRAARALRPIASRSHASMWRWVQRLGPILGSIGADPREVRRIFIDETMVDLGGTPAWIWVAFESDLRAMLDFHVSWRGNSIDAYLFIRRLVRKYGGIPIYTDGAGWYADACRRAGAEHVVYDRPLRNLMERMVQYIKDGTEAFDDPFPSAGAGRARGERSSACITGSPRSCSCRTSCSRTGIWGGPRSGGGRRGCRGG